MKGGRGLILLLIKELLEGGFLLRAALEEEDEVVQRGAVGECSLVKLGGGVGVGVSGEGGDPGVIDRLQDPGAGRRLSLCGNTGDEKDKSRKNNRPLEKREPRHLDPFLLPYRQKFSAGELNQLTAGSIVSC
jgi:hypothetical protein